MWSWFTFFLLVHIIMAISAFGPTYAFPVIAKFAKRDPRNAHLATEVIHTIHMKVTIPAAVAMPFIGLALIYLGLGQHETVIQVRLLRFHHQRLGETLEGADRRLGILLGDVVQNRAAEAARIGFAGDRDDLAGENQATDGDREAQQQDRERLAVTAQHAIPPPVSCQL